MCIRDRDSSIAGMCRPACPMRENSPSVFRETVLPPVFGPVTVSYTHLSSVLHRLVRRYPHCLDVCLLPLVISPVSYTHLRSLRLHLHLMRQHLIRRPSRSEMRPNRRPAGSSICLLYTSTGTGCDVFFIFLPEVWKNLDLSKMQEEIGRATCRERV